MSHLYSTLFEPKQSTLQSQGQYRGRFAPSPSGPLHFGSLLTALGSYLQAKSQNGLWFVRIEDIDKPREQPGAVNQILDALLAFGMQWDVDKNTRQYLREKDNNCLVQTTRLSRYEQILEALKSNNALYPCHCTRKQIKQCGPVYTQTCKDKTLSFAQAAIRLKHATSTNESNQETLNVVTKPSAPALTFDNEDYIVKRRDGLFAYQLVVVIDDIDQGITEVVRGADILPLTTRQIKLFNLLGVTPPNYLHLPVIATEPGLKLSKQNHATAIDITNPLPELIQALSLLGLPTTELAPHSSVAQIIEWATQRWTIDNLPTVQEIII